MRPVAVLICDQIPDKNVLMSSEVTGRVAVEFIDVAEDNVGRLSTLLSRADEPIEDLSPLVPLASCSMIASLAKIGEIVEASGDAFKFVAAVIAGRLPSST